MRTHYRGTLVALAMALELAACGPRRPRTHTPQVDPDEEGDAVQARVRVRLDAIHVHGAAWFADELEPVRAGIAQRLSLDDTRGWSVIPIGDVERVSRLALNGRRLMNDQPCGVPAPAKNLLDSVFTDADVAKPRIDCDESHCTVSVSVTEIGPRGREIAAYVAEVEGGASPSIEQLVAATNNLAIVPALAPVAEAAEAASSTHPVEVVRAETFGTWSGPDLRTLLSGVQDRLDVCVNDVQREATRNGQMIEISAEGRVTRCEREMPDHLPDPAHGCVCDVYRTLAFGRGAAGRRAVLGLAHHPAPAHTASRARVAVELTDLRSPDPSVVWAGSGLSPSRLGVCFARSPITETLHIPMRFAISSSGATEETHPEWPATLDSGVRACLVDELSEATFACPQRGAATQVEGVLTVTVTP